MPPENDPTPPGTLDIALRPTDQAWDVAALLADPSPCSRCGRLLSPEEVPVLIWTADGRMWGFHMHCVGITDAPPVEDDADGDPTQATHDA